MSTLFRVENVWKKFPRTHRAKRRYASELFSRRLFKKRGQVTLKRDEHWALRDISLQVNRGQALGVIGANGSGKSTLLSLIGGSHQADRGSVEVNGQVSSFINLSSGMNGSLSGIENIFYKGSLEGRSYREVSGALDSIVEFSGLGDRVEDPVATYSSGMKLRLAFSVAVHSQPDILLVDEILAVGDFEFKQKCLERVQAMREQCAFVLVSHSMPQIARFCDRAAFLEQGSMRYFGDVKEAIRLYQDQSLTDSERKPKTNSVEPLYLSEDDVDDYRFEILQCNGETDCSITSQDTLTIRGWIRLKRACTDLRIAVPIKSPTGEMVTAVSTEQDCQKRLSVAAGECVSFELVFPNLPLNPGKYVIVGAMTDGNRFLVRQIVAEIKVTAVSALTWGSFTPKTDWQISVG